MIVLPTILPENYNITILRLKDNDPEKVKINSNKLEKIITISAIAV